MKNYNIMKKDTNNQVNKLGVTFSWMRLLEKIPSRKEFITTKWAFKLNLEVYQDEHNKEELWKKIRHRIEGSHLWKQRKTTTNNKESRWFSHLNMDNTLSHYDTVNPRNK